MRIYYSPRAGEWVIDQPSGPNTFHVARLRPLARQPAVCAASATNVAMQFRVPDLTDASKSEYVQIIFDMRVDPHVDGVIRNVLRASPKATLQAPFGVVPATFHNSGCERLSELVIPDDHPLVEMLYDYMTTFCMNYRIKFTH